MINLDKQKLEALIEKKVEEKVITLKEMWESEVMTENEACEFLKLSRPTLLKLRKEGKIEYKRYGKEIRYKRSDLLNIGE